MAFIHDRRVGMNEGRFQISTHHVHGCESCLVSGGRDAVQALAPWFKSMSDYGRTHEDEKINGSKRGHCNYGQYDGKRLATIFTTKSLEYEHSAVPMLNRRFNWTWTHLSRLENTSTFDEPMTIVRCNPWLVSYNAVMQTVAALTVPPCGNTKWRQKGRCWTLPSIRAS